MIPNELRGCAYKEQVKEERRFFHRTFKIIMYVCNTLLCTLVIAILTVYPAYDALTNAAVSDFILLDVVRTILWALGWVLFMGDSIGIVGLVAWIATLVMVGLFGHGIVRRKFSRTDVIINGAMLGVTVVLLSFRPIVLNSVFPDISFPSPFWTVYEWLTQYLFS